MIIAETERILKAPAPLNNSLPVRNKLTITALLTTDGDKPVMIA